MIGIENRDSSFFSVEPSGLMKLASGQIFKEFTDRVLSFEVVEEWGKMITGSIQFYDDDPCNIAYVLRLGTGLDIQWGYKSWDVSLSAINANPQVIQIMGAPKRRIKAIVTQPAGGGGADGTLKYTCNLMQSFIIPQTPVYNKFPALVTKGMLVTTVLTTMGIPATNQVVAFARMAETFDTGYQVVQDYETDFQFLVRLSLEWRTIFRVAYNAQGIMVAVFADLDKIGLFSTSITEGIGLFNEFRYKTSQSPNVKSYTWQYNAGENGTGDNVRIVYVNGQAQYWRTVATTESVRFYKLETEFMKQEMAKLNPAAQAELYRSWMGESSMESLIAKGYYTPVNETTAPQGIGLSMNIECIGDPLYTAPNRALFSGAFPDYFLLSQKKQLQFFIRRVTHKIDRSGYNTSIEVVDAFTLSGGTLVG